MLEANYLIRGLDEPDLVVSYSGTVHFIKSIIPDWYRLDEIELAGGEANLIFLPQKDVPDKLARHHYAIGVEPHKKLEVIAKEVMTNASRKSAVVRYVFLNCKTGHNGKPFFHFDVVEKHMPKEEADAKIALTTTVGELLDSGYILLKSGDDEASNCYSMVLKHRKAS